MTVNEKRALYEAACMCKDKLQFEYIQLEALDEVIEELEATVHSEKKTSWVNYWRIACIQNWLKELRELKSKQSVTAELEVGLKAEWLKKPLVCRTCGHVQENPITLIQEEHTYKVCPKCGWIEFFK